MVPTATELHAALLMGLNVATLLDQGHAAIKELSMTQAYSVQVGYKAVDRDPWHHGFYQRIGTNRRLARAQGSQCRRRHQRNLESNNNPEVTKRGCGALAPALSSV